MQHRLTTRSQLDPLPTLRHMLTNVPTSTDKISYSQTAIRSLNRLNVTFPPTWLLVGVH